MESLLKGICCGEGETWFEHAEAMFPCINERTFWDNVPEKEKENILCCAHKHADFLFHPMSAGKALAYSVSGERKGYEDIYFENRYMLSVFILAECLENKGAFLPRIIDGLWGICEETSWALPAHYYLAERAEGLPDVTDEPILDLFAGETAQLLSAASVVLQPVLDEITPVIVKRLCYEIKRRVVEPYLRRDDLPWMGFLNPESLNNWNPWCNSNCLLAGLIVLDDDGEKKKLIIKALKSLSLFYDSYGEDGGCDEGAGYWDRAAAALFESFYWIDRATCGRVRFCDDPKLKKMANYIRFMAVTPTRFVNFADARADVRVRPELIYRFGDYVGEEELKSFAAGIERERPCQWGENTKNGMSLGREIERLGVLKKMEEARSEAKPEICVWLRDIEVLVARTLPVYGQGLVLAAKYGHNNESHNHNDVGSFVLYKDGQPVFIDVGVGRYTSKTFSEQRYEIWTMQSNYHNLPVINGQGQKAGRSFSARSCRFEQKDKTVFASANIETAYSVEGLEKWERSFYLHEDRAQVVIKEDFAIAKNARLEFVFMSAAQPEKTEDGILVNGAELSCLRRDVSLETERIDLTDDLLQQSWGDRVYRTRFILDIAAGNDSVEFVIE